MHPTTKRVPAWLAESVAALGVKRGERVLVSDDLPAGAAAQIVRSVGAKGIVILAARDPSPELREAADAIPSLRVLDVHLTGDAREDLGRFDAYFAAPTLPGPDPPARFASIARYAVRLGGRALLDLPGPGINDDLGTCLTDCGLSLAALGFALDDVQTALVAAGLRAVSVTARTSLELIADPTALVELAQAVAGAALDPAAARIAATRILAGRPEPAQTVWRRVRASAQR